METATFLIKFTLISLIVCMTHWTVLQNVMSTMNDEARKNWNEKGKVGPRLKLLLMITFISFVCTVLGAVLIIVRW